MTQEEILTAVAYLQAVWDEDTEAVEVLSSRDASERGILEVVIDLADRFGQIWMLIRLGIREDMEDDEQRAAALKKVDDDPTMAVTAVLIDAYRRWAKSAEGPAVRELSLNVIGYLAMSAKATKDEIPTLFEMLRTAAIANSG
ncbi:hypothetical protein AB0L75_27900 [Streptomyces sp. NPDC052101]|uniref:hypothetical protein n=1 Tax=Streptomyces sp. NPDC052101 TaxID=3155763 RepID=UPI00343233FD